MQRVHIAIIKDNNTAPTVLTIPDNPTNGDIQQAILPKHWEWGTNGNFVHVWGDDQTMTFTLEWWNAPYKGAEHGRENSV